MKRYYKTRSLFAILIVFFLLCEGLCAQSLPDGLALYDQLRAFTLSGNVVKVEHFQLKRDRVTFEFTGLFYPQQPVGSKVVGAVFIGEGRAQVTPWSEFERDSVQRFLKTDTIDVTFKNGVLRFNDDTFDLITKNGMSAGSQVAQAQKLASELDEHLVHETGLNLSARITGALLNNDQPGIFFSELNGGKVGRFAVLLDHQARSISETFELNGGEKGMLFQDKGVLYGTDIWTTFYDERDFKEGRVNYSDVFDLVAIPDYRMRIDLREADHWLRNTLEMDIVARRDGVIVVPFSLNEGLPIYDDMRLKKGMKIKSATIANGTPLGVIHEPWETGLSLVLPHALKEGEKITVHLLLEAEHPFYTWKEAFSFPLNTTSWYPRHGYLGRSRFDLTFLHRQKRAVISVGDRIRDAEPLEGGKDLVTQWVMKEPVSFVAFGLGPFERHTDTVAVAGRKIPVEFYSAPGGYAAIKEDFVVAELMNGVNFFSQMFGDYPYKRLGAAFFPSNYGQGFPTMLLLPVSGYSSLRNFSFIAHEGSHEWWGNMIAWRSYRDQWLSEGFAEYSAALYTSRRDNPKHALDLVKDMRQELSYPPGTDTGIASGKLYEVGPLIMGSRLSSRRSYGAYTALTYAKGALVLRMLHFLFTNPVDGDDKAFYAMMKDFVQRNKFSSASTENFFAVASEHFVGTPIAQKFGLKDLNWFLRQWVYTTGMPKYHLSYSFEPKPGGGVFLTGSVTQEGVPDNWFMPLPLTLEFDGNKVMRGTVYARGPQTPVKIALPAEPKKVRLDPDLWVLSEKTSDNRSK